MPRKAREKSATDIYHVMIRGINKEKIFNKTKEKEFLKKLLIEKMCNLSIEIYAYCIMDNHLHLLLRAELACLATYMSRLTVSYAQYYNLKKSRVGHVFQNRYRSECIITEDYFWNCLRYIHLNPVKAYKISNPSQYHYSSYKEFFKIDHLIIHNNVFDLMESRFSSIKHFKEFHLHENLNVFIDIEEEQSNNLKEISLYIISEIQKQIQFSKEDISKNHLIREQLIQELKIQLNINKKLALNLLEGTVPYLLIY